MESVHHSNREDLMKAQTSPLRKRLRRSLTSGLVLLVPVVVTVWVLRLLFGATSSIFLPFIDPAVVGWPPVTRAALSIVVLLLVVYLLGELATNYVGRRVVDLGESLVLRVPIVKVVYSATKQVAAAFQKTQSKAFKSVVFVEFPRAGMRSVGFVTGGGLDTEGGAWKTVYIPTTPNVTTGFLQMIPEEDLLQTDYSVEEGIKMVLSLGSLVPEEGLPARS